jgi:SAM-dependent methyltransferase
VRTVSDRYLPINEEGHFVFDGEALEDQEAGQKLLSNIRQVEDHRYVTSLDGVDAYLEPFDSVLLAKHIQFVNANEGEIDLPYGAKTRFRFSNLSIDEWDRFHGVDIEGRPFVFSRQAQVEFFDMLDSFDDDSVTIRGAKIVVPPWLRPESEISTERYWTDRYQQGEDSWEKGHEAVPLPEILPQLKLTKSRVLVLGAGSGNDAAYFAKQGHVVTAVDFSSEALARARQSYGSLENLSLVKADIFQLPESWTSRFDVVFEHTCYCAVSPDRRGDLVKTWTRVLQPQGHLLGIFFVMEKTEGPPWGGSEWEVRQRLRRNFDFLFWTRWRRSLEGRKAKELVVYARKKAL